MYFLWLAEEVKSGRVFSVFVKSEWFVSQQWHQPHLHIAKKSTFTGNGAGGFHLALENIAGRVLSELGESLLSPGPPQGARLHTWHPLSAQLPSVWYLTPPPLTASVTWAVGAAWGLLLCCFCVFSHTISVLKEFSLCPKHVPPTCLLLFSLLRLCGTAVIISDITEQHLTCFYRMFLSPVMGRRGKEDGWREDGEVKEQRQPSLCFSEFCFVFWLDLLLLMMERTINLSGWGRRPPGTMQTSFGGNMFFKKNWPHLDRKYICISSLVLLGCLNSIVIFSPFSSGMDGFAVCRWKY